MANTTQSYDKRFPRYGTVLLGHPLQFTFPFSDFPRYLEEPLERFGGLSPPPISILLSSATSPVTPSSPTRRSYSPHLTHSHPYIAAGVATHPIIIFTPTSPYFYQVPSIYYQFRSLALSLFLHAPQTNVFYPTSFYTYIETIY